MFETVGIVEDSTFVAQFKACNLYIRIKVKILTGRSLCFYRLQTSQGTKGCHREEAAAERH